MTPKKNFQRVFKLFGRKSWIHSLLNVVHVIQIYILYISYISSKLMLKKVVYYKIYNISECYQEYQNQQTISSHFIDNLFHILW